jgi:hypothetical protein
MNYTHINQDNMKINNLKHKDNLNIDYSNNNSITPLDDNIPPFLLFSANQGKYFKKYSKANTLNNKNDIYSKFRAVYFSPQNIININEKLKTLIKNKTNTIISDIKPETIKNYLHKILNSNYNSFNNFDMELNRLNNIVLTDIFNKSIHAINFHKKYIKDITDVNHRYSNYNLPININNKNAKYVNTSKRYIEIDN